MIAPTFVFVNHQLDPEDPAFSASSKARNPASSRACRFCSWTAVKPCNERPSGIAYRDWSSFATPKPPDRDLVTLRSAAIGIASVNVALVAP